MSRADTERIRALLDLVTCRPLLCRKDLARRYGCCLWSVTLRYKRGDLPPPIMINLGKRLYPAWRPGDLDKWDRDTSRALAQKLKARREKRNARRRARKILR